MIAEQELQNLLNLPDREKLRLASLLLESLVNEQNGHPAEETVLPETEEIPAAPISGEAEDIHPSAKWLLSKARMYRVRSKSNKPGDEQKIPFLSLAGIFDGGAGDTGERADEICRAEIKRRSGFTMKEELPE